MMQTNTIADRVDELAWRAAALTAAINGLEVLNDEMRSGVSELAWDMRESLRKLSDDVLPNGGVKIEAVAS